ncbi:MAG: hypothetical protein JXR65_02955 [Bacteroidales bacterium]|nr:hypothetical protein [Bacteroidales bacterium]
MKLLKPLLFLSVALLIVFVASCQKNEIINSDPSLKLNFSNDSVLFDTVFTSLGSATKQLMVYNPSREKVIISDIALAGGDQSPFRINIDGEPVPDKKNVELAGGDSLYIFAKVTIDPTNVNNPFVVEDSLLFQVNGNNQVVHLVAWGQNAHYIVADHDVSGYPPYKIVADSLQTTDWTNDKPYVIYGYAVVNSYGKLNIEPGTRIYFHKNSGLWVYANGQLTAQGTIDNPITFRGDRLESSYADLPGQWDRIWIMEGQANQNNTIENAIIKNGFIGIQAESFFKKNENALILKNVIIENMDGAGIYSRNYTIEGKNLVVANCGNYCMAFTDGGNYNFIQSTIANYWTYSIRNNPAVMLTNYVLDSNDQPVPNNISFNMGNSIIYGYNDNEFGTQMVAGTDSSYFLDHCLIKTTRNTANSAFFNQIIKNTDPLFKDIQTLNLRLDTLSPAIGKGSPAIGSTAPYDILGNPRGTTPDLGAYQFVPGQGK